jgi:hypothetical protein
MPWSLIRMPVLVVCLVLAWCGLAHGQQQVQQLRIVVDGVADAVELGAVELGAVDLDVDGESFAAALKRDRSGPQNPRTPVEAAPDGVIDLADGGYLPGRLLPARAPEGSVLESIPWASAAFATPFDFRLDEISGLRFAPPPAAAPADRITVRLRGGDVISGVLTAIDAEAVTLVPAGARPDGTVRIARRELESLGRRAAGGGSFVGPGGLAGWQQAPAASWREEAGRIITTMRGASVVRDVGAPRRARFDIVLSWKQRPEFRLAVAAGETAGDDTFWLEMLWPNEDVGGLMLVRREGPAAEIRPLPVAVPRADLMRIILFVDQEAGRLAVVVPDAADGGERTIADIVLPPRQPATSPRFRLTLTRGDICLESLRVTPWKAADPMVDDADEVAVTTRDGKLADVVLESFDAAAATLILRRGEEPVRVPLETLEQIVFPASGDLPGAGEPVPPRPTVRGIGIDGDMLAGTLVAIDDQAVWIDRPGCSGPVPLPFATLLAVKALAPAELAPTDKPPGRLGRLVSGASEFQMQGWLTTAPLGGIAWQPLGSRAGVALSGAAPPAATVEYIPLPAAAAGGEAGLGGIGGMVTRDGDGFYIVAMLTEDGAAARDGRMQPGDRILAVAPEPLGPFVETRELDAETVTNLLRGRVGTMVRVRVAGPDGRRPRELAFKRGMIAVTGADVLREALETHARLAAPVRAAADAAGFPALVFLRTGDVAPCRIEAIGPDGVRLVTPAATDSAAPLEVPAAVVQAVELVPAAASRSIDRTRLDRLLTLPRMQRVRPPTHLLRLTDGDYLRGRDVRVDGERVTIELQTAVKTLPRDAVARIIWLHPEDADDGPAADDLPGDAEVVGEGAHPAVEAGSIPVQGIPVQGVTADGRRMTLAAESLTGNLLRGRSPAFGDVQLDLGSIDRLLIGGAIDADDAERPYSRWKLKPAAEPRALQAEPVAGPS